MTPELMEVLHGFRLAVEALTSELNASGHIKVTDLVTT